MYLRCARVDGVLWYDLGNTAREIVRIDAEGWQIMPGGGKDAPVFIRHPHMLAQVRPATEEEGDVSLILDTLNARDEDSRILLKVYLCAAFLPDIARPLLMPHGPAQSGKSTLCRRLRRQAVKLDSQVDSVSDVISAWQICTKPSSASR